MNRTGNTSKCRTEDRSRKPHRNRNQGSTVIEVTLIMGLVLVVIFLILTMLLGVWKQAEAHADMMTVEQDGTAQQDHEICTEVAGDRIIYSKKVCVELVRGYAVKCREYQIERNTETEQRLRRWQLFGNLLSD